MLYPIHSHPLKRPSSKASIHESPAFKIQGAWFKGSLVGNPFGQCWGWNMMKHGFPACPLQQSIDQRWSKQHFQNMRTWVNWKKFHSCLFTLEGSCSMFFCVFSRWQVGTAQVQESESVLGNWRSTVRNTVKATSFGFHRGQPFVRY